MQGENTVSKFLFKMKCFFFLILLAFASCTTPSPTNKDVIGTWKGENGAEISFKEDGTFTGKSIPAEYILLPPEDYKNIQFSGRGDWELRSGPSNWEVYIEFRETSDKRCLSAFPLLLWGEKGILQNKPPWYLFLWKEEEGGERFALHRE